MIQVNRIYLIFNRLVTKKFLVDTSVVIYERSAPPKGEALLFIVVIQTKVNR